MTTVCIIQHVPAEGLGSIAQALKAHGVTPKFIRPFQGERIPRRLASHSGLIILGGPMSVYEQPEYPFLRDEILLIQDALKEAKPILGVCLGCQLLAAALGAAVTKGKRKELGWHPVTLTRPAAADRLWRGLPSEFTAFHWHGDIFNLPRGAVSLARSELTRFQAFRYGQRAYGLLFHLEMTPPGVRRMTRTFKRELCEAGVNERPVFQAASTHLPALQTIGLTVFARWAALVLGKRGANATNLTLRTKRACEPPAPADGARILVDRLWPRGVKKESLRLDAWLKDLAPTDRLRRFFHHGPARWPEFRRRYFAELDRQPGAVRPLLNAAA